MKDKIFMMVMMAAWPAIVAGQTAGGSAASAFNDSILHELPEVMITGEKPVVTVKGAKLVFDVRQLIKDKAVDNAFDALKQLPGVTPQGEDVNLGGMSVSLMLNGKLTSMTRSQLIALLKSTPASKVESAEVMYAAPARYQVRGALINVVLVKSRPDETSLQGELFGKAEVKHEAHFSERASLRWHRGRVSMDADVEQIHGKSYYMTDKIGMHTLADGTRYDIATHETINVSGTPEYHYRIGVDLDWGKNHQLSVSYAGNQRDSRSLNRMTGMQTSVVDNHVDSRLHNGHIDYELPIGLDVGTDFTYYENNVVQDLGSELMGSPMAFVSNSQQRINRWKCFVREEHAVGKKAKINYGLVYTHVVDHSRQDYRAQEGSQAGQLPAPLVSRRTENVLNAYVGGNIAWSSKLSAEMSVAIERTQATLWNRWDLYPSLTLSYTPRSGRLWQLAFSSDKTYPDFWAVQHVTSYHGGQYEEIIGNPGLRPSREYSVSLVHILHNKYTFRGWFSHQQDYFTQTMFQSRDRLVEIDQFHNFDFHQQAGLMVAVPWKPVWWFDSRVNLFGVWMREKDGDYFDCPFDRSIVYGMLSAHATCRFSRRKDVSVSVSGFARTTSYQGTLDLPASGNLDVNLRYAFARGNVVLNVYCKDIFQTMMITPECHWGGQNLRTRFACYRTFGLSLAYKFGGYKAKHRQEVDMQRMKK